MRLNIFFAALMLSLPFWLGINLLENKLKDFFFLQEIGGNPQILSAQVSSINLGWDEPARTEIPQFEAKANAAISIFINAKGKEMVLFEKNPDERLPVASLTKLMTALVVLENYDLVKDITISKNSVDQKEEFGKLEVGKTFKVNYLLYPLLMESSNDAASSLANDYDGMTEEEFVSLMNLTAVKLGLSDTHFFNPTGLDEKDKVNYSTASDFKKLTRDLLRNPIVWEILSTPKFDTYGPELISTNKLLLKENVWRARIMGGKTGYTQKAGGCMMLTLRAPKNRGVIINIVLGTSGPEERFAEMERLVAWTNQAYKW